MKTNSINIKLIIIALILSSCSVDTIRVSPDHAIIYKQVDITDYNAIEIANDFTAYVTFSETEENIEIEANDNLQQHIIAKKIDNKLVVKLKNNINVKGNKTLNVYITTKSITDFSVVSDSKIYLETPLTTDYATINIAADSHFVGAVNTNRLTITAQSDAAAYLYGTTNELFAKLYADSNLSDFDLEVEDLKLEMTADCEANLSVNNTIDVKAFADCTLHYKGNPTIINEELVADSEIKRIE